MRGVKGAPALSGYGWIVLVRADHRDGLDAGPKPELPGARPETTAKAPQSVATNALSRRGTIKREINRS